MEALQRSDDIGPICFIIPEEIATLSEFLLLSVRSVDTLSGVRMETGIIYLGRYSHRRRSKILDLFEMKIKFLGLYSELSHIEFMTAGVA